MSSAATAKRAVCSDSSATTSAQRGFSSLVTSTMAEPTPAHSDSRMAERAIGISSMPLPPAWLDDSRGGLELGDLKLQAWIRKVILRLHKLQLFGAGFEGLL